MFKEFLAQYGMDIIHTIVIAVMGYVGITIKNLYDKYVNTEVKKSVVKTCVKAVEQLYTDLHGDDKLNKCIEYVTSILAEKGIVASDVEIRMLVEAAVKEMNARAGEALNPSSTGAVSG